MTEAFDGSGAEGGWVWKDAYEAAEAAAVLFLQRDGRGMRRTCGAASDRPRRLRAMLEAVAALEPSHTRRSEEQVRLQQFSTPLPLAYAAVRPGDVVLEPSAGTGMLAVMTQCALGTSVTGNLQFNEYAQTRVRLLTRLFPQAVVTAFSSNALAVVATCWRARAPENAGALADSASPIKRIVPLHLVSGDRKARRNGPRRARGRA